MSRSNTDRMNEASNNGRRGYGAPSWDYDASAWDNYRVQDEYARAKKQSEEQDAKMKDWYKSMNPDFNTTQTTASYPNYSGVASGLSTPARKLTAIEWLSILFFLTSIGFCIFIGSSNGSPSDAAVIFWLASWGLSLITLLGALVKAAVSKYRGK